MMPNMVTLSEEKNTNLNYVMANNLHNILINIVNDSIRWLFIVPWSLCGLFFWTRYCVLCDYLCDW